MDFNRILGNICQELPNCYSAVVMNIEGMVVARQDNEQSPVDAEAVLIELLAAIKAARQAAQQAGGSFQQLSIDLNQIVILVRMVGEEHFVALILAPTAIEGKGRFLLRLKSRELSKELV